MGFGARLRELRKTKGLTQEAVARAADLSHSFIAKLEQTESDPSWTTVQKLAAALGVDCTAFTVPLPAAKKRGKR